MSFAGKKTVWILGAGFSRSLGGPLLYDLLSLKGQREAEARFGSKHRQATEIVYGVYQDGLNENLGLWAHAEEFLEVVDLATEPSEAEDHRSATGRLLLGMITRRTQSVNIREFRARTLIAIAAECSFDRWSDPRSEAWSPYLEWGKLLTKEDSVITFNYDTVLERLSTHLDEIHKGDGLISDQSFMLPPGYWPGHEATAVFKMHGSLRWGSSTRGSTAHPYTFDGHWDDHTEKGDFEPLIGMPGSSKSLLRKKHFDNIWGQAMRRIKEEADVIVFFGYRFPPSDAQSRSEILAAIKRNTANYLRIHIVLGPDVNHPDTVRLAKMLEVTLRGAGRVPIGEVPHTSSALPKPKHYAILRQPLYVQDFMTILDENFMNTMLTP